MDMSVNSVAQPNILLFINGKPIYLPTESLDPRKTLLHFLRDLGLTGTKLGCGEGGCGACTVMLSRYDKKSQRPVHLSANACLTPLCAMDGVAITTVEGIGGMRDGLHPVQKRVAALHGSQCGFCTPGIVMAIYSQLRMKPDSTPHDIEESLDGNLCRCTGYRPILDAARSLSCCKGDAPSKCCQSNGSKSCCSMDENASKDCVGHTFQSSEQVISGLISAAEELTSRGLTEPIFPPKLTHYEPSSFAAEKNGCTWFQASTLNELLRIKSEFPRTRIVIGNSEVHIEVKFKDMEYAHLVNPYHVQELQTMMCDELEGQKGISVGGAITINALRQFIDDLNARNRGGAHLRGLLALRQMLDWFASNHIRNVASVAGNIVTASPISDLNPMLMALDAKLKLSSLSKGSRWVPIRQFFVGYRRTALYEDEIVEQVFIPYNGEYEFVLPFKQAKRREDDISIVTGGLFLKLDPPSENKPWKIIDCAFALGGMAVTTVLAKSTSKLIGQTWSMDTFHRYFDDLRQEFTLPSTVPGGKAEYRTVLVLSFLLKAFYSVSLDLQKLFPDHAIQMSPEEVSGSANFVTTPKPTTRGEQSYSIRSKGMQTARPVPTTPSSVEDRGLVGQPIMHKSAEAQVCGEAKYTLDLPVPGNTLHASLVLSTRAHAKILNVDISEAEKSSGFVAYFSHKDVQGTNHIGAVVKDEEVFAESIVKYYGAVIGVVVAKSHHEAVIAAKKVKVDYEDLPAVITIDDAIAAQSFFSDHHCLESGDLDKSVASADIHVEGTCRIGGQEHFYLETNCTVATPIENGMMEITSSTQACTKTQMTCASVCGLPAHKVVAKCKRLGGGFGGKETRSVFIACTAALAAHILKVPVSINIERDIDMSITGQRHAFVVNYSAGCTKDGSLSYLKAQLYSNAGYSMDLSLPVMDRALFHCDNAYRWPAMSLRGTLCRTNQPSHTAFRGFGGPQGMMVCEAAILQLAHKLGVRPEFIREKNLYREGDLTHFGQPLRYFYVPRLWSNVMEAADVANRRQEVDAFNKANKWRKRGLSVLATKFGISFTAKFMNQGGALVHVYSDGSVLVAHGGTEMGQGLNTKVIQIAAQCFQIPDSMVFIAETSTSTVPNSSPSAASLSTDLYGMAVLDACEQIAERLRPVRERMPSSSWSEIVSAAYFQRVNLSAQGFYIVPNDRCGYDWSKSVAENAQVSTPFNYFTQGAACTEVEVDILTGDSRIVRTDILMDVGKSINPAIDIGQIEGAFMQGFGWSTMEEMVWGDKKSFPWVREGQLFTRGPGTYKIPAFNDVPVDMRVHLADTDNRFAVHSSKAVGEPPFFLGASAYFAIHVSRTSSRTISLIFMIYG